MRLTRGLLLAALVAGAALGTSAGVALAWWSADGLGAGHAASGGLSAPSRVTATQPNTSIQNVHVTWGAVVAPDGDAPDGYYVERVQNGATTIACDSSAAAPLDGTRTACDDVDVPLGASSYRVVARFASWSSAGTSAPITVVQLALTSFTVSTSTMAPTAGVPFSAQITATVADGSTKTDYTGTQCLAFSGPATSAGGAAPVYPATGSCASGSAVAFAGGVATVSITLTTAETAVLRVSEAASGRYGESASLTIASASPVGLAVTRQPATSATAGATLTRQPRVAIVDLYGNTTTSTASVSLAITGGGATFSCAANPLAAVAGVADFTGCAIQTAGTWTFTASSGSLAGATTYAVAITAASPAVITAVSGGGQSATVGTAFGAPLVALVADAYGNPVAGATVTFTAPASGATARFSGSASASASTAANGRATSSTPSAGTVVGSYTIAATASGTAGLSFGLANTPGGGASLTFTRQPSSTATAGVAFGTQPQVTVLDAFGNVAAGSTASITLAASTGATVACATNPVPAASGVATFAGCSIAQAGTWTLTASSGALTAAISSSVTVSPTGIASILDDTGSKQSAAAGSVFAAPLVARVQDALGNPLSGITVTFTAPATGARVTWAGASTTTAVSDSSGRATAAAPTAGTIAGTFDVTAAAGGFTTAFAETVTPASPTKLVFVTQPAATMTAHTAFSVSASVTDTYGNTVTTVAATSLNLALTPATSLGGCSGVATVAGVATWTGCTYDVAGSNYTLTASGGGYLAAISAAFAITPAAASAVTASSGSGQSATVGGTFASALAAKVTDAYGNAIVGSTVTFTAPATGATAKWSAATSTTATTASTGIATTAVPTAGTVSGSYTVTATVTGATSASFTLTNTAGTATKLVFTQQPAGATATFAFVTQPKVAIADTYGNTVTTASGTITLAITSGTGTSGATLSSCAGGGSTSGVATFSNCKISLAGTGYTLRATSGTYTAGTSAAFNVSATLTVTAVATVNKTGGTPGTTEAGDKLTVTFSASPRASTMCAAWTSDTTAYTLTDGVVAFNNNGNNDTVTVSSAGCTNGLKLGTLTIGAYISSTQTTTYTGSTIAWDPTTRIVTVTLGTTTKSITNTTSFTMSFAVSTSILDLNGRAASGTRTVTGVAF